MAEGYLETSLIMWKKQVKTSTSYQLMPVRGAAVQTSTSTKRWGGCGEQGTPMRR